MAKSGVRIGGAYFEFEADNAQLLGAFVQSKAKAQEASQAIQKAVQAQTAAIQQGTNVAVAASAAQTKAAQSSIAAAQQAILRYQQMRQAAQQAATGIGGAGNQIVAANNAAGQSFLGATRSMAGFAGAVVGLQVGAAGLHSVLAAVTEQTKKAADAQFALNKTYGVGANEFNQYAARLIQNQAATTAEIQKGAAIFGTLQKNYGFTTEQIKRLIQVSMDMAAVTGVDLTEAFKSVQAAMRGEGEAAEKLGFTLNRDAVKAMANMTAEQRKNFETLSDVERAQIIYNEALRQAAPYQGAAAEKAQTHAGAIEVLAKRIQELEAAIGKTFLPAIGQLARELDPIVKNLAEMTNQIAKMPETPRVISDLIKLYALIALTGPLGATAGMGPLIGWLTGGIARDATREPPTRRSLPPAEELPAAQDQAQSAIGQQVEQARARAIAAHSEEKRRIKERLEAADDAAQKAADVAVRELEREKKAKNQWYDEEKQRLQERRDRIIEALEYAHDRYMKTLEEEAEAAKQSFKDRIELAEREKEVRIMAANEAKDQAIAAIEAEEARLTRARTLEDRQVEDTRRNEDRILEDFRRREDSERESNFRREQQRQERLHEQIVSNLDEQIAKQTKAGESRVRALDDQIRAVRRRAQEQDRQESENNRRADQAHKDRMNGLEDELKARTSVLDVQIEALEAAEKQEKTARRIYDLERKVAESRRDLQKAQGSGDQQAVQAATQALQAAIRSNDYAAALAARRELDKAAGTGNVEEIQKAQEDLAQAERELNEQRVDDARDAEKEKLVNARKAIEDEIAARKEQFTREEENRKASVQSNKEAEDRKLQDTIDRLEKRKQKVQDATKDEIENIRRRKDEENKAFEQYNENARLQFDDDAERLRAKRELEDRDREDRRREEDRAREDRRREEDLALQQHRKAVEDAHKDELRATEEFYNGPNGVITQLRKSMEATAAEYAKKMAMARAAFEEEKKMAERTYQAQAAALAAARQAEIAGLDESIAKWRQWEKDVREAIANVKKDLDEAARKGIVPGEGDIPAIDRTNGSGTATQNSPAQTKSNTSGKFVKGDLPDWLNDAMDITGVSNDWLVGLQKLVQLESGGDPHARNKEPVIDQFGVNHGHATGLLQTLPGTFAAYRDKKLANDIYDPVANAVAAIYYISKTYGHVKNIPGVLDGKKFKGYDSGGLITEPTLLTNVRTGRAYGVMAEYGPERIQGRKETAIGYPSRSSLYGSPNGPGFDHISDLTSGLSGGSSTVVNFNGSTDMETYHKFKTWEARQRAMNSGRYRGPR